MQKTTMMCNYPLTAIAAAVFATAALALLLTGCTQRSSRKTAVTEPRTQPPVRTGAGTAVPTPVANAGEYGEDIYDAVDAGKWSQASSLFNKLEAAQQQLDTAVSNQKAAKKQLTTTVASLKKNIADKERQQALLNANQVTLIAADISAGYSPAVPVEISKLDYYGRQLMICSAAKNTQRLKTTAHDLEQTWTSVRPNVVSHGGKTQAQDFDTLVEHLRSASSLAQYRSVARQILDSVDKLEQVYAQ